MPETVSVQRSRRCQVSMCTSERARKVYFDPEGDHALFLCHVHLQLLVKGEFIAKPMEDQ